MSKPCLRAFDIKYHHQDEKFFCGAASAMMILAHLGVDYSKLDQSELFCGRDTCQRQCDGPDAPKGMEADFLCCTLNLFGDGFLKEPYTVQERSSEQEATRDIVFTVCDLGSGRPPAVLIRGDLHWVVVYGVQCDVDPIKNPDDYTLDGLWVHNPTWDASVDHHHDGQDACTSLVWPKLKHEMVPYHRWNSANWFDGRVIDTQTGQRQWTSVGAKAPPAVVPGPGIVPLPRKVVAEERDDGRELIEPERISELARAGLDRYALWTSRFAAEALESGEFGEPPVLVEHLDRPDEAYYLVPWMVEGGRVTAIAQVDAHSGLLDGFGVLGSTDTDWRLWESSSHRRLVWKPCRESWSSYLPFYQETDEDGRSWYVRIDGERFFELTSGLGG
jgi:hypothetical protein